MNNITDTLDIVSHSMGYAYALGMIDAIKQSGLKIPFGRFYIIAPEDAGVQGTDWTQFTEVWQYGSDEVNDPLNKQDGVAPQVAVPGIGDPALKIPNGRAYIPNDGSVPRGFISSHSIENYRWIFTRKITEPGYVTPRN